MNNINLACVLVPNNNYVYYNGRPVIPVYLPQLHPDYMYVLPPSMNNIVQAPAPVVEAAAPVAPPINPDSPEALSVEFAHLNPEGYFNHPSYTNNEHKKLIRMKKKMYKFTLREFLEEYQISNCSFNECFMLACREGNLEVAKFIYTYWKNHIRLNESKEAPGYVNYSFLDDSPPPLVRVMENCCGVRTPKGLRQFGVIRWLLSLPGIDVNVTDGNHTPLITTAIEDKWPEDIIAMILANGADVNTDFSSWALPLRRACESKNPRVVCMLLNHGANPFANDAGGNLANPGDEYHHHKIDEMYRNFIANSATFMTLYFLEQVGAIMDIDSGMMLQEMLHGERIQDMQVDAPRPENQLDEAYVVWRDSEDQVDEDYDDDSYFGECNYGDTESESEEEENNDE